MSLGFIQDFNKVLPIVEVYKAIQGEGERAGKPTIVIRTTGCTHRCSFGEGGWCDSWYTSIHPEKGQYCLNDILKIYNENPHIIEMMLTGGSPTMHPQLVNTLTSFCYERGIVLTIETEGSHFLQTDKPIHFLSISPKFNNSVPKLGVKTPLGKTVDQRFIDQHNKFRLNYNAIKKSIEWHRNYQIKPVIDKDLAVVPEIEDFLQRLQIPNHKVYAMPAGDNRQILLESYAPVMTLCIEKGWNFTGRPHIIAHDTKRCV